MLRARWILATAMLCGSAAMAATPATPATTKAAANRPVGIDLSGVDHNVQPGDDFFRYANGSWLKTAKIPADRSSTGTFLTVFEQSERTPPN